MTYIITTPVPQAKVPPNDEPGYAITVWINGVQVGYLGGKSSKEAEDNALTWLAQYRNGSYCNDRQVHDGRICDMPPEHEGLHTDGELSWGDSTRLAYQMTKLP